MAWGAFCFTATGAEFKEIFLSTRSTCLLTLSSPKREFLSLTITQLLGGPNRGWHAVLARILGVSMAEPEKGILIISWY